MDYHIPKGVHAIPDGLLDLQSDAEIDHDLLNPAPVSGEKNVWFFWHAGFHNMHPYTQRNARAWHRRLSRLGWTIRVLNRLPGSPLNIDQYLDTSDPGTFPQSFIDGRIGGDYAPQHTSDLVRFPLLIKYGGVYADVGLMQIGDLDRLWNSTIGDPSSPYEIIAHQMSADGNYGLTNYFLASGRDNPFYNRCHQLLLALWAEGGGKADTEGMHTSPLIRQIPPLMQDADLSFTENGKTYGGEELSKMLTDYIIQGQVITMVMRLIDEEGGWNGPKYVKEHIYAIDYMVNSQLINEYTDWNGTRAWELMSLPLPKEGEEESEDQKLARTIVETCLSKSFAFKLAHGFIIRVMGQTLGSLWRTHTGSDDVEGTYAHWLRSGIANWTQDELPTRVEAEEMEPLKVGTLLRES